MTFCKIISYPVIYRFSPKVDNPSHSVLYLSTGTLSQNEVGILLKWWRRGTGKNSKFWVFSERRRERERPTDRQTDRQGKREREREMTAQRILL